METMIIKINKMYKIVAHFYFNKHLVKFLNLLVLIYFVLKELLLWLRTLNTRIGLNILPSFVNFQVVPIIKICIVYF